MTTISSSKPFDSSVQLSVGSTKTTTLEAITLTSPSTDNFTVSTSPGKEIILNTNTIVDSSGNLKITKSIILQDPNDSLYLKALTNDENNLIWGGSGTVILDTTLEAEVEALTELNLTNLVISGTISGSSATSGLIVSGKTTLNGATYTWPSDDGLANQVLLTDGDGVLSWIDVSATSTLSGLGDTLFTSLTNNDITAYNSSTGKWVNTSSPSLSTLTVSGDIATSTISSITNDFDILLTDNRSEAFDIRESTNSYLKFVTTNANEKITLGKKLEAGSIEIEGTNFDINGGYADNIIIGGTTANAGTFTTLATSGATTFNGITFTFPSSSGTNGKVLTWPSSGSILTWDGPQLETLDDVSLNTLVSNNILQYSGSRWINTSSPTLSTLAVTGNMTLKSVEYQWPADNGTSGQYLQSDGNGVLTWVTSTSSLSGLTDTTITSASTNQVLKYSGSAWINSNDMTYNDMVVSGDFKASGTLNLTSSSTITFGNYRFITFTETTTDATVTTVVTFPTSTDVRYLIEINASAVEGTNTIGLRHITYFHNDAGTVSKIGTADQLKFGSSSWTIDTSVSTTNILIRVTGEASTTINWKGDCKFIVL